MEVLMRKESEKRVRTWSESAAMTMNGQGRGENEPTWKRARTTSLKNEYQRISSKRNDRMDRLLRRGLPQEQPPTSTFRTGLKTLRPHRQLRPPEPPPSNIRLTLSNRLRDKPLFVPSTRSDDNQSDLVLQRALSSHRVDSSMKLDLTPDKGRRRWQTVGGEEGEGRKEGRETEKEMMGGDDDHDERDTKKNKKPRQQLLLQQEKEKEAVWTTGTALESNSGPAIKPRAQLFNLSTTNTISSSSFSFEPLGVADVPSEAISAPAAAAGMVPLSDRSEARTMGLTALSPPPVAQFFICPSNGQNGDEDADGRLEG
ncbi:hypothetical protein FRC16_000135, partial [Serendipita sp. 398]